MKQTEQKYMPLEFLGERMDTAVASVLGISRSLAANLIDTGQIIISGKKLHKSDRVAGGEIIEVLQISTEFETADRHTYSDVTRVSIQVLYADDEIIVVDKPVGVAAHSSPGWQGQNVLDSVAQLGYEISTCGIAERQGIVHRLDVGTSGVMLLAKTDFAYSVLKRQFKARLVVKTYHTVVQGLLDPLTGTIDAPIGRHPNANFRFAIVKDGRPSITHYETLEAFRHASLVSVEPKTGRTHQIRVHMAAMRHPCVGDTTYSADPVLAKSLGIDRQWLHAVRLQFAHPTSGDMMIFESPYPSDLAGALSKLKSGLA